MLFRDGQVKVKILSQNDTIWRQHWLRLRVFGFWIKENTALTTNPSPQQHQSNPDWSTNYKMVTAVERDAKQHQKRQRPNQGHGPTPLSAPLGTTPHSTENRQPQKEREALQHKPKETDKKRGKLSHHERRRRCAILQHITANCLSLHYLPSPRGGLGEDAECSHLTLTATIQKPHSLPPPTSRTRKVIREPFERHREGITQPLS